LTDKPVRQKTLLYDPSRCTGCGYCEIVCTFTHYMVVDPGKAYCHPIFEERTETFENILCQHCELPLCVTSCPSEAATKDEKTGLITINEMKCISCGTCTLTCPISHPRIEPERKSAVKCDFCDGDPQCAKFCSPRAIRVVDREEALQHLRRTYSPKETSGGKSSGRA